MNKNIYGSLYVFALMFFISSLHGMNADDTHDQEKTQKNCWQIFPKKIQKKILYYAMADELPEDGRASQEVPEGLKTVHIAPTGDVLVGIKDGQKQQTACVHEIDTGALKWQSGCADIQVARCTDDTAIILYADKKRQKLKRVEYNLNSGEKQDKVICLSPTTVYAICFEGESEFTMRVTPTYRESVVEEEKIKSQNGRSHLRAREFYMHERVKSPCGTHVAELDYCERGEVDSNRAVARVVHQFGRTFDHWNVDDHLDGSQSFEAIPGFAINVMKENQPILSYHIPLPFIYRSSLPSGDYYGTIEWSPSGRYLAYRISAKNDEFFLLDTDPNDEGFITKPQRFSIGQGENLRGVHRSIRNLTWDCSGNTIYFAGDAGNNIGSIDFGLRENWLRYFKNHAWSYRFKPEDKSDMTQSKRSFVRKLARLRKSKKENKEKRNKNRGYAKKISPLYIAALVTRLAKAIQKGRKVALSPEEQMYFACLPKEMQRYLKGGIQLKNVSRIPWNNESIYKKNHPQFGPPDPVDSAIDSEDDDNDASPLRGWAGKQEDSD